MGTSCCRTRRRRDGGAAHGGRSGAAQLRQARRVSRRPRRGCGSRRGCPVGGVRRGPRGVAAEGVPGKPGSMAAHGRPPQTDRCRPTSTQRRDGDSGWMRSGSPRRASRRRRRWASPVRPRRLTGGRHQSRIGGRGVARSAAGREAMPDVAADARLAEYQPYWAARADLLARTGAHSEARRAYEMAIGLERDPALRRFLQGRRAALPR